MTKTTSTEDILSEVSGFFTGHKEVTTLKPLQSLNQQINPESNSSKHQSKTGIQVEDPNFLLQVSIIYLV